MSGGYFLDIQFLPNDPQFGFICGFDGNILLTKDGGNSWSGITVQGRPFLESIHFVDRMHGFVSGPSGVFKTVDGGSTWLEITDRAVNMSQIWGCYFVDKDNGLYIGGGCAGSPQLFVKTRDGGNTWSTFQGFESESGLSDLILYDKDGPGYAVSSGLLWQTLNGGVTWTPFTDISGPRAWAEEITNRGTSFLLPYAGDDCSGGGRSSGGANFTTDNGKTWKEYRGTKAMFGSFLIDQKKGWICGDAGEVLYTTNAGDTWEKINCGLNGANIDDLHFVNDSLGWAVGEGVFRFTYKNIPDSFVMYPKAPFCEGDTVVLSIPSEYRNIRWNNNLGSSPIMNVSKSGTYIVTAFNTLICRELSDTVNIDFEKPIQVELNIKGDTVFCKDEIIDIAVLGAFTSCKWSDGISQPNRTLTRLTYIDTLFVEVFDAKGCSKILNIPSIKWANPEPPFIEVIGKSILCNTDSTILSAEKGYMSYTWSDGQKGRTITINKPGDYTVRVIDSLGCETFSLPISISRIDLDNFLSTSFSGKKELEFDSTVLGSKSCINLSFTNRNSMMDYLLELPFIMRNIEFSMPMSQFPIRIKPGDSLSLSICFSPDSIGIWRDTIVFKDTCSSLVFPLKGIGIPFIFDEQSECDINITSTIISTGNKQLFEIRPHPLKDQMSIHTLEKNVKINSLYLFDAFGNKHDLQISSLSNLYPIPNYLPSGMYIPIIETSKGMIQLKPVLIIK
jgi:photosystem II stability/assembly factor-like uncharacterized protein